MPVKKTSSNKTSEKTSVNNIENKEVQDKVSEEKVNQSSLSETSSNNNSFDLNALSSILSSLNQTINNLNEKINKIEQNNEKLADENKSLKESINELNLRDVEKAKELEKSKEFEKFQEVESIKNSQNFTNESNINYYSNAETNRTLSNTERLLEYLTNKKSDREVTIVHNRELVSGLSTHIVLTGTTIDFRTLGEKRVLSWQQFEECVSKYRKWFNKQIILLDSQHKELAETYNVPCVERKDGIILTRNDLQRIGDMSPNDLEKFYNSLTEQDKDFFCSFWLGKCYINDAKFYDRYKVELLNRLSNKGIFDNILALMNNDFARKDSKIKIN